MDRAVAVLAKAVTATAAIGFVLSAVIMVATGTLFAYPLLPLSLVAGIYSGRVVRQTGHRIAAAEPELRQRILVT